jgi:hypothetical protein
MPSFFRQNLLTDSCDRCYDLENIFAKQIGEKMVILTQITAM